MESICCSLQMNVMKKTMAAAAATAGLLLCFFSSASAAGDCNIYKATGGNVTLKLHVKRADGQIITWSHDSKTYVEVKNNKERCCDGSMKDMLSDGSLHLTGLTKAKGGKYQSTVYGNDGKPVADPKTYTLCVLDPVKKPILNFTCTSKKKITLKCVGQEQPKDEFRYKWFSKDKEVATQTSQTYRPNTADGKFQCAIHNQVSEERSDAVISPCDDPGFVFPEELLGISIWVFVAAGGGVVVLLIMLVICCCVRNRRRRRMHIKDEEEYRLRFAPANQHQQPAQHQHHHHHHHPNQQQRQPPGHTGPRQHRPKGQNGAKGPEPPAGQPRPSPRRTAQGPRPVGNDEDPPPLPQPRKKGPKGQRA